MEPGVPLADHPTVSPDATREATVLFDAIENHEGGPKLLRVAISRMSASLARSGSHALADSILDVAIALEIKYGPIEGEQRYKLATRAAYLLGKTAEDRKDTYEAMTGFYQARSRIVHGRASGNEGAAEAFDSGFEVALRTLKKIAFEGVPADSEGWDRLVVAGGTP